MSTGPGGLAQAQPQHDAQGEGQGNRAHDQSAIQEQVQGKTQPKSKRWNLWMVAIGLIFSLICTSLDRSIVSVATPAITSEFNSLADVGWYASAYLLPMCAFQLPFGKLYAELRKKYVFLAALTIFEVGSIVCATAPTSVALIIGRAIAGLGGAGITSGALIITATFLRPQVPELFGIVAGVANLAQAFGPLIGGALSSKSTWRWCFWINLPIGAVTAAIVVFFLNIPAPTKTTENGTPDGQKTNNLASLLQNIDWQGTILIVPAIICLLLALQWGGEKYPWSNWRLVLLLCLFGVLIIIWTYVQVQLGDRATVPLRLLRQRVISFGSIYVMSAYGSVVLILYYVPIWFQAVRGLSPSRSGIDMCAFALPWTFFMVIAAQITVRTGYYMPQMVLATILISTMSGLFTLFKVDTSQTFWAVTLVFYGLGVGLGAQQPFIAAQTTLKGPDIALGTSLLMFIQLLSGAIMVSVGQSVFYKHLTPNLESMAPGADPETIIALGTDKLPEALAAIYSPSVVQQILLAYNSSLRSTFVVAVCVGCISSIGCMGMEWKKIQQSGYGRTTQKKDESKIELRAQEPEGHRSGQMTPSTSLPSLDAP